MKVLIHKGILLDFSQFIYLDIHVVKSDIHDWRCKSAGCH